MKTAWRQWLYRAGVLIGAGLLAYQVWTTAAAVRQNLVQIAHPVWLGAAAGLILMATAVQIAAWIWVVRWLGVSLSAWRLMRGYILPFMARYIPGSIWGYLGRSHWLEHHFSVPYSVSNLSSILEVASLLASAGLVAAGYLATVTRGAAQAGMLIVTVALVPSSWLMGQALRRWPAAARWPALDLLGAVTLRRWIGLLSLHLLFWLGYGAAIVLTVFSLGQPLQGGWPAATFAFATAWVAGFLFVFVPAGLGVREVSLVGLLMTQLGLGMPMATAVALAARAYILIAELVYIIVGLAVTVRPSRAA